MTTKYQDTLNRIEKGEAQLAKLKPDDPKRDKMQANLDKLRADAKILENESKSQALANLEGDRSTYTTPFIELDPRPDLKDDSNQWSSLLKLAYAKDANLCGVLNGIRCGGTRLKVGRKSSGIMCWTLKPEIDPSGRLAWKTQAEYDEAKKEYLLPYFEAVSVLLVELEKRHEMVERITQQEMRF